MAEEQQGIELMAKGDKLLRFNGGRIGKFFGGSSSKIDEAMQCYRQAGNKFKMAKSWSKAGQSFTELALLHQKHGNRMDAATNFVEAGNCFKKCDANLSIRNILKAIDIYTDMGKFIMAAKQHQNVAEMYETELVDTAKAAENYERAVDYFRGENSTSAANRCLLKVAMFSAQTEKYEKAIQIYDEIASAALENSLLKYSATGYMFRAALCRICADTSEMTDARISLQKYEEMNPAFEISRENKFVQSLMKHVDDQDVDGFTDVVKQYESVSRLDPWITNLLLRIKKSINSEDLC